MQVLNYTHKYFYDHELGLIAVTANVHNLVVVTRNASDMERCQARVFNPWESQPDK